MFPSCKIEKVFVFMYIFGSWSLCLGPVSSFDAVADADELYKALTISATRISDLVNLLTKRSCAQRSEIKVKYEEKYGPLDNLMPQPEEYGRNWYMIVPSSFLCNATLYAYHADKTMNNKYVDSEGLGEILVYCSQTAELHDQCLSEYKKIYNQELGVIIKENTSNDDSDVLMEMIERKRDLKPSTDPNFVAATAQALLDEKEKWNDHRDILDKTMMQIPLDTLKKVLIKFQEINHNKTLLDEVGNMEGWKAYIYRMLYNFAMDETQFYSDQMYDSLGGKSKNELLLMRVIFTTRETNFDEIRQLYEQQRGMSLSDVFAYQLSGDESKALIYGFANVPLQS